MFHTGLREIMVPIRRMSNQQCNKGVHSVKKCMAKVSRWHRLSSTHISALGTSLWYRCSCRTKHKPCWHLPVKAFGKLFFLECTALRWMHENIMKNIGTVKIMSVTFSLQHAFMIMCWTGGHAGHAIRTNQICLTTVRPRASHQPS